MLPTLSVSVSVPDRRTAWLTSAHRAQPELWSVAEGASGDVAMQGLGVQVALCIMQRWTPRPVLVLCGPGGNGSDGLVAAARLAQVGWPVRVAVLGAGADACEGGGAGGLVTPACAPWRGSVQTITPAVLDGAALVVDAICGTGLRGVLAGTAAQTLAAAVARAIAVVAIDLPSGVVADNGLSLGAVACVVTVTGGHKKPGHLLQPGRSLCGELVVADIDTPAWRPNEVDADTFENGPVLWRDALPALAPSDNKYTRGHALVWGGWPTTGAARMAAMAAARVGAGLTTIVVPEAALNVYAAAMTSVMVQTVAGPEDLSQLLSLGRFTALLMGPGAGAGQETRARVLAMLSTGRPMVLDADALTAFEHDPQVLFDAIAKYSKGACVLTPHSGEFLRLFGAAAAHAGDKLSAARAAARTSGAIVMLKGSDTVIAAPNGLAIINTNAPPTLATAGAGDVLAGLVLGLLAQGMAPWLAAAAAVWLHGAAASRFGPGLLAQDLPECIPGVLRRLARGSAQVGSRMPTN